MLGGNVQNKTSFAVPSAQQLRMVEASHKIRHSAQAKSIVPDEIWTEHSVIYTSTCFTYITYKIQIGYKIELLLNQYAADFLSRLPDFSFVLFEILVCLFQRNFSFLPILRFSVESFCKNQNCETLFWQDSAISFSYLLYDT